MFAKEPELPVTHPGVSYRPHIDGLRGLAIAAVVLYHARLFWITGGYVGVDIFFVISGFLITSIIVRDLHRGTFSLKNFWERRIRRIFPPLFVMMFATAIAAYFFILYPPDYHHFGNSLMAQSIFGSNVLFLLTDNYFDQPSRYSPLLHTWSLSVEEQFYVVFPLLIALCLLLLTYKKNDQPRLPHKTIEAVGLLVLLGTILSFALNVWFVDVKPDGSFHLPFVSQGVFWNTSFSSSAFYLLFTRAWELGLGIIAAIFTIQLRSKLLSEAIAALGVLCMLAAIVLFHDATPFPGVAAGLPTLGAFGFIVANEFHKTYMGRLFSLPLLVGLGLISYALYLWHWPLFVYAQVLSPNVLSAFEMLALAALACGLAFLSYKYVETPVRRKQLLASSRNLFITAFLTVTVFLGAGLYINKTALSNLNRIPSAARKYTRSSRRSPGK
jgi:peptidoglycan/LPS O-acetylase OafA/YrhL